MFFAHAVPVDRHWKNLPSKVEAYICIESAITSESVPKYINHMHVVFCRLYSYGSSWLPVTAFVVHVLYLHIEM